MILCANILNKEEMLRETVTTKKYLTLALMSLSTPIVEIFITVRLKEPMRISIGERN